MTLLRSVGLVLLSVLVAGCPAKKQTPEAAGDKQATEAGNGARVVIKGSNTIGEELAPALIAEFKKEHPAVAFELEPKATGYGIANLLAGKCDIAAASRAVVEPELQQARTRGVELNDHTIGSYSVAVIVNAGNPVGNLTQAQVRDIFIGTVQNWKDVGGPDAPIRLFIRDPISGTHLGFRELAMENSFYAPATTMHTNYADIVQAVVRDANGIGYSSFDLAKKSGVKSVSIGGIVPTATSVNEGKYPYARMLHLYTNKEKEAPATRDFILFIQSARGQEILEQTGFVPRP